MKMYSWQCISWPKIIIIIIYILPLPTCLEQFLRAVSWGIVLSTPHSSTLTWKIPWTEEPGRLQPIGSQRVGHDWATSLSLFTFMHWRRKWQTHSSVLAWRIPGTGEPGGLPSVGSHRVAHDWSDSSSKLEWMSILTYLTYCHHETESWLVCLQEILQ